MESNLIAYGVMVIAFVVIATIVYNKKSKLRITRKDGVSFSASDDSPRGSVKIKGVKNKSIVNVKRDQLIDQEISDIDDSVINADK